MSALVATLRGRCPACREGGLHAGFLVLHELCPGCGVRFERYVGTRTIATVLSFGVGALVVFGFDLVLRGVGDDTRVLMALAVGLGAVLYPLFQRLAVFLLWQNGLVTVDTPEEPRRPRAAPSPLTLPEPLPALRPVVSLPQDDDPTWAEDRAPDHDDPTDERVR